MFNWQKINSVYYLSRSYFSKNQTYLILFVTSSCNSRCKMCFYWKNINNTKVKEELTLNEYIKISQKLKNLAYLSITGGEPILREDLLEIIHAFYINSNTRFVNITTNGSLPEKTNKLIRNLLIKCPNLNIKLSISLDGLENIHDNIRGINGLFKKALQTYNILLPLKNHRFALNIATTLSALNKDHIFNFIDYVSQNLEINDHTISFVRGDVKEASSKDIDLNAYSKTWHYLIKKEHKSVSGFFDFFNKLVQAMYELNQETLNNDKMIVPCLAVKKFITIKENGDIYPCEIISYIFKNYKFIMGNLRDFDYDINKVLKNPKSKEIISFIKNSKCHCGFECANLCNIVLSKKNLLKFIIKRSVI
ncbi:4Fe-4S cluster-binding domain-containing protein [Candidatus Woesearchaeota archaeon]|nr:4Fe-4S cluster-binding domain-containing protein [Candidatus Woesearchaeota archaeon]